MINTKQFSDSLIKLGFSFGVNSEQFLQAVRKINEAIAEYQKEIEFYKSLKWYDRLLYSLLWDWDDYRNILRYYWKKIKT